MIEINIGTLEERIIKLLHKIYPITVDEIKDELNVSTGVVLRVLKKLQMKGIVRLDPLPDKIYVRLIRNNFSFIGRKQQRKFLQHNTEKKKKTEEYDGMMYS